MQSVKQLGLYCPKCPFWHRLPNAQRYDVGPRVITLNRAKLQRGSSCGFTVRWRGRGAVSACIPRRRSGPRSTKVLIVQVVSALLYCSVGTSSTLGRRGSRRWRGYGEMLPLTVSFAGLHFSVYMYTAVQIHAKLIVMLCAVSGFVTPHMRLRCSGPFIRGWGFVALLVFCIKYCTCPGLWKKGGCSLLIPT